jgi:membrane complex biogenesis BtpA family protein
MLFDNIFPKRKCIIGMIALPPLLGYPQFKSMARLVESALSDLDTLQRGGVDGVCVENDYDRPHRLKATPEIVASFTRVAHEVVLHAVVPVGLQVLLNDWRASLAIAKVARASFVRLDFFVDTVRIQAGEIRPVPAAILAYRKKIRAQQIALFTDIQVKHSTLLERGKTLATSAQQAILRGSDAIVVTGDLTGQKPALADLREARESANNFPILVGSGATSENIRKLLRYADGAIVGTAFKRSASPEDRVNLALVRKLIKTARARA